jgi:hypothetical protein
MTRAGVGRVPVVTRGDGRRPWGMLTRSDLLSAHARRLDETHTAQAPLGRRAR